MATSPKFPELPARRLTDGPKPKHAQLREILEEICTTKLEPGDMLPGERVLEETFGVSRITVRRAIGDLVASGRLKRARGKGTFVAPAPLISRLHLASFSSEMSSQGLQATSEVLLSEVTTAPEEVEAFFRNGGRQHVHLRRLRLGDGRPYAIDDSWYNRVHAPDLLSKDVRTSIYGILDRDYRLPVTEAEQIATAVNADETTAGILDVEPGTALLKIVRLSLSGEHPVEWCSSLYRTDRYTLKTHVERATDPTSD
ncbi:GntR family transcriptional regulator [Corynebacterium sp. CCM 9185]|uniref:GntR family transcriptional regulator n=1 Tax=Corynebacterium marambiense TaxID=2765364 RepID=A0ABS0VWS7_9CORY|nr:GntR family transcriptional regulator [Corynebacterium marambiense]MBI9001200.1 GntR family transcriptional regulator [Corynebacterium marambiense]MCK7663759.1 GntR family transcriptional regulator [Corynebacterium marambiense]MCX7542907.1 GntR family transcriptional regulator [Corynebacterium marambiense]